MPKRIDELTEEQKAAIPAYRDMWIAQGLQTGDADWETFDKYMPICYEKAGLKYPKRVVRVQSPLVGGLAASVADAILKKYQTGAVRDAVRVAVDDAVGVAVDGAVRDAVGVAVRGAVRVAVRVAVDDAVGVAVDGAVRDAVDGAVGGAVDGAVRGAVRGAVDVAVGVAVRGAVRDAVRSAVGGAVDGAVRDAVRSAVRDAMPTTKKAGVALAWHYWLGGQFWVGGWYWGNAFVNFFFDICKLELSKDIMERAEAYRKVNESVNYIWPNSEFVIVCDRPKHILRDSDGRLHSTEKQAIEYKDGWGLYMIHGVKFTKEQFNKAKTASVTDILSWEDIDQRSVLLRERPIETLLESVEKKLIDHTEECGGYDLWELDLKDVGKTKILTYKSWSTKKPYAKFVPLKSENALETVASLRHQTVEELKESYKS